MKKPLQLALACGVVIVILLGTIRISTVVKRNATSPIASQDNTPPGQSQTLAVPNNQPSSTFLPGTKFAPEGLTVADNTFVYDSKKVDLNGDGSVYDVVLYGVKNFNDSPFVGNICVAIKDSKTETFSVTSIGELNAGYQPELFIGRFTNAKNNAILVSLATGGSGGVTQYSLLTNQDNKPNLLIPQKELNDGLSLETRCLPGFKLKLTNKKTGYITTIDLHQGSMDYVGLGFYNKNGELLKDPMVLIDGFGVLKPEDVNGDGIYELHGIQSISVGFHANRVANAESVWTVSNGQLKLLSEKIVALN